MIHKFNYFIFIIFLFVNFVLLSNYSINSQTINTELKLIKDSCTSPILLVSTIDGTLHALEVDDQKNELHELWSFNIGTLISSSVNNLQLYNDDNTLMRIIPSLDGSLFKYFAANENGDKGEGRGGSDYLERIPFNMEELLKSSVKLNKQITFIGGILTQTLGIDSKSGHLVYNCSSNGCESSQIMTSSAGRDDLLVIKQTKYLLRAVSIDNGMEKWNISLIKNEIIMYPNCSENQNEINTRYDQSYSFRRVENIQKLLRFDVAGGIVTYKLSNKHFDSNLDQTKPRNTLNFQNSIVTCDLMHNGILRSINVFTKQYKKQNSPTNQLIKQLEAIDKSKTSSIYIGKYNSQFYAQYINYRPDSTTTDNSFSTTSNPLNNMLVEFKQAKTKSTVGLIDNNKEECDLVKKNQNSLVPLEGGNLQSTNQIDNDKFADLEDIYDSQDITSTNNEFIGWYFFEKQQKLSAHYVLITRHQAYLIVFTGVAIIIGTIVTLYKLKRKPPKCVTIQAPKEAEQHDIQRRTILHQSSAPTVSTSSTGSNSNKFFNSSDEEGDELTELGSKFDRFDDKTYNSRFLNDFEDIRLIGKGGFGYVFQAKHGIDNRMFAIKRIRLKNQKNAKERVLREVRTLAKLESPYIVRYFHSWFEYPPLKWQNQVDKILLERKVSYDEIDCVGTNESTADTGTNSTNFSKFSNFNTNNSAIIRNSRIASSTSSGIYAAGDMSTSSNSSSSSSFILFQNEKSTIDETGEEEEDECFVDDGKKARQSKKKQKQEDSLVIFENSDDELPEEKPSLVKKSIKNDAFYIYIQMELCQRETLRHWLDIYKDDKRERIQILSIFDQIMHAISYIHSQDLIHRDLKPSNIFLSLDGKMIKIGDFGLVVSVEQQIDEEYDSNETNDKSKTQNKKVQRSNDGTFLYMSPEQLKGEEYNSKVDIYSLGIILFELIVTFNTQMERIDTLKNLHKCIFPKNFSCDYDIEYKLISLLINTNPELRPTANELFNHRFYKDFQLAYND